MKFWAVFALAAAVAAVPFEGVSFHKRAGARSHIGYRIVSKVGPLEPPITDHPLFEGEWMLFYFRMLTWVLMIG